MSEPWPPAPGREEGTTGPRRRILGIDVARALAILGMLAVHVGPTDVAGLAGRLYALPHGRASVLFVLVAGVGVGLLARARRATGVPVARALLWRALVLLPAGLVLQELGHRVFVILQTYAVLFALAPLATRLPGRGLLALAGVSLTMGPLAYLAGVTYAPETFDRSAVRLGEGALMVAHRLLLSGPYPIVVWAAPFLLGMWVGRHDLRSPRVRRALVAGGAAAWAVAAAVAAIAGAAFGADGPAGWARLADATPHGQMPLWMLGSIGSALVVVGACLHAATAVPRAAWPLAAMGQLALTIYVAHLLALHAWSGTLRSEEVGRAAGTVVAFAAAAAGSAVAWRARFARGPLEALLRPPGARPERPP